MSKKPTKRPEPPRVSEAMANNCFDSVLSKQF